MKNFCGWSYKDGTISIKNNKAMRNYCLDQTHGKKDERPWSDFKEDTKTVEFRPGVSNISEDAFAFFKNLANVLISKTVTGIEMCAFNKCVYLTKIDIPSDVKILNELAFSECSELETVEFKGIPKIVGEYTFEGCKKLKKIIIPVGTTIKELPEGLRQYKDRMYYSGSDKKCDF